MVPVLVVDHDKDRLAGTAGVLSSHGYCPLAARFDSDALSLLSDMPVEVALVECQTSRSDRATLVASIRRRHPHVAVIVVVERGRADDGPSGSTHDALDVAAVVQRPFLPATLINAVGHRLVDALAA